MNTDPLSPPEILTPLLVESINDSAGCSILAGAAQEDWRLIDVEDWAEIRRLHKAEGMGIKTIAMRLEVARNTVQAVLRLDDLPPPSTGTDTNND